MNKTKIDWCESTFNPITGCLHECDYCYARGIARRFAGHTTGTFFYPNFCREETKELHDLEKPKRILGRGTITDAPYPYGFDPTLYRYRLDIPQKWRKPRTIFVGSMCDMFGEWIPDEWIHEVFKACEAAPQHRYLFLTKNPKRYGRFGYIPKDNYWYGTTITCREDKDRAMYLPSNAHRFFSVEPIHEDIGFYQGDGVLMYADWVIVGVESGNSKNKVVPKREWIESIVTECRAYNIPVFMKSSLAKIWQEPLIQQFPWKKG